MTFPAGAVWGVPLCCWWHVVLQEVALGELVAYVFVRDDREVPLMVFGGRRRQVRCGTVGRCGLGVLRGRPLCVSVYAPSGVPWRTMFHLAVCSRAQW